ncbi:MAG TPA: proton-conducting transporter membrane subunit [Polyangia bacterium]|jgi:Formate hydrogenlyase subunit 3/Multisubunit Na+/H+ antiporter, MnhD subunit|nr:proton-conducting transporter membrane subunit [Polyangia bacterium]
MDRWRLLIRVAIWLGHLLILGGAAAGATVAFGVLTEGAGTLHVALPHLFPFAEMSLCVDGLSAFFLLVVSLVTAAAALYGPSYLAAHAKAPVVQTFALGVFVVCMAGVCCAGDGLTFLLAWEGMTLASYALVVSDARNEENTRAGLLYLVMAHAGTAALLVVFLSLAERGHGFDFDSLRTAARGLESPTRTALFVLALVGFGAKAGVVPLHVWLPKAHPAAPSHASALMSGVMLKVALYGIFRFGFDILAPADGPLPASWGWTVLLLGTVSAVIGVLLALQQHDLKRLLAFHSVENVGIILIGAGLAMLLGHGSGAEALATLALAASLLHTLNHAAFKGLLFLGAGSVISRTGVRNMEELGGLARRMPWTAWLFLLGAVAISALPPLNGFVSEWMTFQALLLGAARLGGASGLLAGVAASMLALTGGLAAACFAKAFGVTFLGRPRSIHAEQASESPAPMIAGMLLLAGACVALGLAPGYAMRLLDGPTQELLGGLGASAVVTARGPLVLSGTGAVSGLEATSISVTGVAALLALLAAVAWALRGWSRRAPRRLAPTWTCGMTPTSRFDYTATAFAKPLRLIFAAVYRPRRAITKETGPSPYVVSRIGYTGEVVDLAETMLYARVNRWITATAHAIRTHSTGRIHGYIAFVLVTLVLALLFFAKA